MTGGRLPVPSAARLAGGTSIPVLLPKLRITVSNEVSTVTSDPSLAASDIQYDGGRPANSPHPFSPGSVLADSYKVNRLQVAEPFARDDDFWVSTRASLA